MRNLFIKYKKFDFTVFILKIIQNHKSMNKNDNGKNGTKNDKIQ